MVAIVFVCVCVRVCVFGYFYVSRHEQQQSTYLPSIILHLLWPCKSKMYGIYVRSKHSLDRAHTRIDLPRDSTEYTFI